MWGRLLVSDFTGEGGKLGPKMGGAAASTAGSRRLANVLEKARALNESLNEWNF